MENALMEIAIYILCFIAGVAVSNSLSLSTKHIEVKRNVELEESPARSYRLRPDPPQGGSGVPKINNPKLNMKVMKVRYIN